MWLWAGKNYRHHDVISHGESASFARNLAVVGVRSGAWDENGECSICEHESALATEDSEMTRRPLAPALFVILLAWTAETSATPTTFSASGNIQATVDDFRN